MSAPLSILFAGGGTGGHVFPGIAIAEVIRGQYPDAEIAFAGSRHKIESRLAAEHGFSFYPIWISGFKRSMSLDTFLLPIKILVSIFQSIRILRHLRPGVVVGTGGYVSGPVLYAATVLGYPTLIQEQNEYPGITTRLLAGRVDETHITFPDSARYLRDARQIKVSGNPVRPSLHLVDQRMARTRLGLNADLPTLFVFGGSLGAGSMNRAMIAGLGRMAAAGVQIIWQTGPADLAEARRATEDAGMVGVVTDFIHDMELAYSAADCLVCRAGATSIAEITALGLPAILVPYPHAADDHQRKNARALADAGAAWYLDDTEVDRLPELALQLLIDDQARTALRAAAQAMGTPGAATTLAEAVLALAKSSTRRTR